MDEIKKPEKAKVEKDNPHAGRRERVRKRYLNYGLESFEDHEVLELLLFYTQPRGDTNVLAHKILNEFGSLANLMTASPHTISRACKIDIKTAILISLVVPTYQKFTVSLFSNKVEINDSRQAGKLALELLRGRPLECFFVICLDAHRRLIHCEKISEGSANETSISIPKLLETVIKHRADSVVLAHNHPSGMLTASRNDLFATDATVKALKAIFVDVLDHVIIAGNDYLSFSEKRIMGLKFESEEAEKADANKLADIADALEAEMAAERESLRKKVRDQQ